MNIKWRGWFKAVPPRPIKLEVPGWAGEKTWDHGQPWHCKPFKDGSTYGLELIYPFDTEVTVTTKNNELIWTGDFSNERPSDQTWERPFSSFAPGHFGFTSSLDIATEPGYGTMILPHPRYYTDRTGIVPLIVGGFIESDIWAKVFFVVFKSPLEGQTYVFRKGEGYAHLLFLPKEVKYNIQPMTEKEMKTRGEMDRIIGEMRKEISTKTWKTITDDEFDNKYKVLSAVAKKENVYDYLKGIEEDKKKELEKKRKKFPKVFINANKLQ